MIQPGESRRKIAEGGWSEVFMARHAVLRRVIGQGKSVAVKVPFKSDIGQLEEIGYHLWEL